MNNQLQQEQKKQINNVKIKDNSTKLSKPETSIIETLPNSTAKENTICSTNVVTDKNQM